MYDLRLRRGGLKNGRFFKALLERHYFMKSNVCRQALHSYLSFFPLSKTVIEINIIPRATFVYKQCPYCNPARSWKWNEAFNELAALSPWGLPHTRTQRQREVEVEREREGEYICNLRIWVRYQGQTALNCLQLLLICLHFHLLILICPSCGNTLPLFSLTRAYDFTAHSSSGPL